VDGELEVGGAALAANCIELDLVEEHNLFVYPVVVYSRYQGSRRE
jgi:hypothetical protein